ncbi:MAG TPA: TetR/AcrR family transcriptional regulator [Pseudonocardiaceae bacterium]|nr:TetR/AcrR family transcriptional regulator [Pseudonocardiaceae bacterium]
MRREIVDAAWAIAGEHGLAAVTLREVASRVGMQSPSLYTHFASKNAIFDAMFAQAWTGFLLVSDGLEPFVVRSPRKALLEVAQIFVDYCVADLARFQLMNQRMVADFEPTPDAYAPSLRVMARLRERLTRIGVQADADADLFLAITGGLIDAQFANDPGGDRFVRLLPRALDMYAEEIGLPGPRLRRSR